MNWSDLNIWHLLTVGLFLILVVLMLWFGGIIGDKKRPVALFVTTAIVALGIVGAFVYLQFYT